MRSSLRTKFILSFIVVALISIVVITLALRQSSSDRLLELVIDQQTAAMQEDALAYYAENGTWVGFLKYMGEEMGRPDVFREVNPNQIDDMRYDGDFPKDARALIALVDLDHRLIIPAFGLTVGDVLPEEYIQDEIALELDGEAVAYLIPDKNMKFKLNAEEEIFLQRTNETLLIAAGFGVVGAVLMGLFLSSILLKPIRNLMQASKSLAAGDLEQSVPVTSKDELGQLSEAFNKMSADLRVADLQRKQMTANITHDLGTPFQVLAGYIEMAEVDPKGLTPHRLDVINSEIEHLRRLLKDLNMLSQADAKELAVEMQPVEPARLVEQVYQTYLPITEQAEVNLVMEIEPNLPMVELDDGRMVQVLKNLLDNALRYTEEDGHIWLAVKQNQGAIHFSVKDDGAGIPKDNLPYIFDRFYRGDKSRTGRSGKSGLGLAISKALVQAQGGTITADSDGLGKGATITISIPIG